MLHYTDLLFDHSSYVRVVTSGHAGMGKSLYIRRLVEVFQTNTPGLSNPHRVIALHGPDIDNDLVVNVLMDQSEDDDSTHPLVYHLDISERVCFMNYLLDNYSINIYYDAHCAVSLCA